MYAIQGKLVILHLICKQYSKNIKMKKTVMLLLALLCMVAQGAWADSTFGGGDGSAKNPYIIRTADHWNTLATDVNGGTTYNGMYFQLVGDITVTTMVGQGTNRFRGTFDGGGHIITVNYTGITEDYCAPFCRISGATIKNLHTAGIIETSGCYASGIVAYTRYYSRIENCRSSVTIRSSRAGWGGHGGILALKAWVTQSEPVIEGCLFDGKILTTGTTESTKTIGCGGIVGFTNGQTLTLKNCIYKPAELADGETAVACCAIYENSDSKPSTVTCTNCYYFESLGAAQGKQAHSISIFEGVTIVPTGNATEYNVSSITGYDGNECVKYNGTVYAGQGDGVTLKFTHNYSGCTLHYSVGGIELSGNDTDGYTLNMPNEDVNIAYTIITFPTAQFSGSGTSGDPYLIGNASEWDLFIYYVNEGIKNDNNLLYATAYYKLTDDIVVTTMVGTDSHRFGGHFDGGIYNGNNLTGYHKLIVNYATDEQYVAPFRYVDGAVISNLCVAGTINTSNKFASGFIANAIATVNATTLTNCRSSVTINSSVNGDGTHGGFVAHNTGGTLTFTGCAFDGQMLGGSTNNCAGFVGWNETKDGANGKVNISNSLFAPKSTQQVIEKVFVRSRSYESGVITITNSHCTADYNVDQQSRIYSITAGDNVTMTYSGTNPTSYSVSSITFYSIGLTFDGVLYAKKDDQLTLTLEYGTVPSGYTFSGFATTAGTLTHGEDNSYTLKIGNANATIYATYNISPTSWSGSGKGTSSEPYIISTPELWDEFVNKVSNGMVYGDNVPYATAYYKLTANIEVTTMAGTEDHRFKGHFDGGSKTLTLSYGTSGAYFNEDYCAPFRYIENANISNLTVGGTIYTQKQFAAGIAANVLNANTITDCRSSVVINSSVSGDGTHGGFVANCQNNLDTKSEVTFTNCAFNGSLLGANTNNCGGFVGWTEGNDWAGVKFTNCLFAPSVVSVKSDGCATFSRGQYSNSAYITVNNSYYTQRLGTKQGEMAYTEQPADVTTEKLTIAGVSVYVKKTVVTDVTATNITPNTATISWKGSEGCSNYQVRYRVKPDNTIYSTSFEGGLPDGWTMFDNDGDGYNWTYYDGQDDRMPHSGKGCMYSASYIKNVGALEPDNWLVSKQLTLGGTMKVWLKGQDEYDYREHFAIYLSTTGGSKDDFLGTDGKLKSGVVELVPVTETTDEYQEYTADLSAYNGKNQTGYIAIRHFNCEDEFYLVVDDFGLYSNNAGGEWSSKSVGSPATITGLTASTTYEYQVGYMYGGHTYYTSTADLTTLAADVAPTDLSATAITSNTATISWKGYGDSYNLRYSEGGVAKVTLSVPNNIWEDGSGYQMLLDKDHNTYGTVIPETGGLTNYGDASPETYAEFEYKIPENADGAMNTSNVVDGTDGNKSVTITIVAGTYDWCITNPSPGDRVWIASERGNVGGRQNDFVFEAGKHYTFTVTIDEGSGNDCVNMTVEDASELTPGDVTEITDISGTSYTLGGLSALTAYTIYVQSVKGDKTSEWSSLLFTTTDGTSIGLLNDDSNMETGSKNTAIIEANDNQERNVTLAGRTLYKDGNWNTLCLPFEVTLEGSPLAGATAMTLSTASYDNENNTLTLNFVDAQDGKLLAGVPYIIKWASGEDIETPVFQNVTVINTTSPVVTTYWVDFQGTYSTTAIGGKDRNTRLYLSSENTLYWPKSAMNIRACRAYFQLNNGLTAGEITSDPQPGGSGVREFILNFGEDTQGIKNVNANVNANYYDLQGRRIMQPTKGLYIVNGKKVVIK